MSGSLPTVVVIDDAADVRALVRVQLRLSGRFEVVGEVLERHLERFRELFEEAAIGMATMTLTGTLVRVNRALAALFERDPGSLAGVEYPSLSADDASIAFRDRLAEITVGNRDVVT